MIGNSWFLCIFDQKWPFWWLKSIIHRHILLSYIILILDRLEEKEIIVDGCHGEDMHQWNVLIIRGHEVMYHYIIFNKSDRVSKWSSHFRMGPIPWESKFIFQIRIRGKPRRIQNESFMNIHHFTRNCSLMSNLNQINILPTHLRENCVLKNLRGRIQTFLLV